MNQYAYASPQDHRPASQQNNGQQGQTFNSYATFHPTTTYSTSYSSNNSFIQSSQPQTTEIRLVNSAGEPTEQRYVQLNPGQDDKIAALLDSYFIDQGQPTTQQWSPTTPQQSSTSHQLNQYSTPSLVTVKQQQPGVSMKTPIMTQDKMDKEKVKRARQAEAARMRYHRLTAEEKRELNLKRTIAQKRKRQREKEMEQLEEILRQSNDIQEDPDVTEQLREKRMRAKWAEAARARYQRMTPDERRAHNNRRRMRQMQNALAIAKSNGELTGDPGRDEEAIKRQIKNMNSKKAEAARARYHRMSDEEKRVYNQRRTEAFRRRRIEEEMLLAMPIGRINGEALDRAQQIVVRNAKRAEAARLRYQRMTPDQRKSYNQKRYTPKRHKSGGPVLSDDGSMLSAPKKELDVLSSIERDVMKRTQQAQQALLRQQRAAVASGIQPSSGLQPQPIQHVQQPQQVLQQAQPGPSSSGTTTTTYVITGATGGSSQQIVQNGQVLHPSSQAQGGQVVQQLVQVQAVPASIAIPTTHQTLGQVVAHSVASGQPTTVMRGNVKVQVEPVQQQVQIRGVQPGQQTQIIHHQGQPPQQITYQTTGGTTTQMIVTGGAGQGQQQHHQQIISNPYGGAQRQ